MRRFLVDALVDVRGGAVQQECLSCQVLRVVEDVYLQGDVLQSAYFLSGLPCLCLKPGVELFLRVESFQRFHGQCHGQLGSDGSRLQLIEQGKVHTHVVLDYSGNSVVLCLCEQAFQCGVGR